MKQLFIILLLMCSVLSYGQELCMHIYQIGSGQIGFFMSDDGVFSFESTPGCVAFHSLEDTISCPNDVWYKGKYTVKKDSIICHDEERKATFVFRRLDENLLLFLYSERCDPKETKEVAYGPGIRVASLYKDLHTYFLLRYISRFEKKPDGSVRLLNHYIWHDYREKEQVYPRVKPK